MPCVSLFPFFFLIPSPQAASNSASACCIGRWNQVRDEETEAQHGYMLIFNPSVAYDKVK